MLLDLPWMPHRNPKELIEERKELHQEEVGLGHGNGRRSPPPPCFVGDREREARMGERASALWEGIRSGVACRPARPKRSLWLIIKYFLFIDVALLYMKKLT